MSEFKFSCPQCQQRIAASEEHAGQQLNCPSCQATITVPSAPATPGAPPPPPPPVKVGKLGVAALDSPQEAQPRPPAHTTQVDKSSAKLRALNARRAKKSYAGIISGVTAAVVVGVVAYFCAPWAMAKWKGWHGDAAKAAEAATNQPPPPPPRLTAAEIAQKVTDTYNGLTSLRAQGTSVSILDMSQINPALAAAGPRSISAALMIKMAKPGSYRLDFDRQFSTPPVKVSVWSAGSGDFITGNTTVTKLQNREMALNRLATIAPGSAFVAHLFFEDSASGDALKDWTETNDGGADGQICYVLATAVNFQQVLVWVSKSSFLIPQIQVVLDGQTNEPMPDDAQIKEALTAANGKAPTLYEMAQAKNSLKYLSKLKGTVTDTFQNIETNVTMAPTDFEPPAPLAAAPAAVTPRMTTGAAGAGNGGGGRRRRGG